MLRTRTRHRRADGTSCNHYDDEPCERCAADRAKPFVPATPLTVTFTETHYEHLFNALEPVRPISNREDLRVECIKRGVRSEYLENTTMFKSGRTRWV